jgi:hypothetical protein
MKDLWKGFVILFLGVAILSGCATDQMKVKDSNISEKYLSAKEKKDGVNLLIEPYKSIGIKVTPAILQGKVTIVKGLFNNMLWGEYFPGRIRWDVWYVRDDGREFYAQAVFAGPSEETGANEMIFIIDGVRAETLTAKGAQISTMADYGYSLLSDEFPIERAKFINDKKYRHQEISKNGTKVSDLKIVSGFLSELRKWNAFKTEDGDTILTPLGSKDVEMLASINPQYSFSEKLIGTGKFSVTMDPISFAQGIAIDLIRAGNAPSKGWDYASELPDRRYMGFVVKYITTLYEKRHIKMKQSFAECNANLEMARTRIPEKSETKNIPDKISKGGRR